MNKLQTWTHLAERAQTQAAAALVEVVAANRRLKELASTEARLHELYADYSQRLRNVEGALHKMSQNTMSRHYIAHVETLLQKLAVAQAAARETLALAQEKRLAAELERVKMQHLTQCEAAKLQRARKAMEQKQLDNLAITRFNLR